MKILIGSSAAKYHFSDFHREPRDKDYIGVGKNEIGIEYHTNPIFDNYPFDVIQPNDLYTLKISHIFWDIKWDKHIYDIVFLNKKGCKLDYDLFQQLHAYWITLHGTQRKSVLSMNKKDFFTNALKKYDHDYLHTLINPSPTYLKVLKGEVEPSEQRFNLLTHDEKINLVREEIYVMAYERLAGRDYRVAYRWMLKKFIMHHAPIWEAIFIVENFLELQKPFFNYKNHLDHELQRNLNAA